MGRENVGFLAHATGVARPANGAACGYLPCRPIVVANGSIGFGDAETVPARMCGSESSGEGRPGVGCRAGNV